VESSALRDRVRDLGGDARVSVLKAVVTQASSATPTMPLQLSLLFKVMKSNGTMKGASSKSIALFLREPWHAHIMRIWRDWRHRSEAHPHEYVSQTAGQPHIE
jgi:trans-2-enoyl-CoA reductase